MQRDLGADLHLSQPSVHTLCRRVHISSLQEVLAEVTAGYFIISCQKNQLFMKSLHLANVPESFQNFMFHDSKIHLTT